MKPQIIRRSLAQSEEHLTRDDDFQTGITFGSNIAPVPTESTDSNYSDDNQDIDIRINEDFSPVPQSPRTPRTPRTPRWDSPSSPLFYYTSDSEYGSHSYPFPHPTSHYPPPPPGQYYPLPPYTYPPIPPPHHSSPLYHSASVPHPHSPSYPPYYHHQSSPPGYGAYSPHPPYSYPPPPLPRAAPVKSQQDEHSLVIEFAKLGLACLPSPSPSSHGTDGGSSRDLESDLVAQLRELISSRVTSTHSSHRGSVGGSRGREATSAGAAALGGGGGGGGSSGGVDIVVGEVRGSGGAEGDRSRSPLSQNWKEPSPPSSSSTSAASADAAGKSYWTRQTQANKRANNRRRSTSTPAHHLSAVGGARLGSTTNGKETRLSATGPTKVAHKKLLATPSPSSPHPHSSTQARVAHSPTTISVPSSPHSTHATSHVTSSLSPSSSTSSSSPHAVDLTKTAMYGHIAHVALEYIVHLLSSPGPGRIERERERVHAIPRNPNEAVIVFPASNSEIRQSDPTQNSYSSHHLRMRSHSTGHSGTVKSRSGNGGGGGGGRGSSGGSRSRQTGVRASGGSRRRSPPLNRTTDTQSGYAKPKLRRWNSSSETALVSLEDESEGVINHKWGENESDYSVDSELVRMSKSQKRPHESRGRVHKTLRQVPAPVPAAMLSPNYDPRHQQHQQQQSHQASFPTYPNYPPSTYSSYPPPPSQRTSYSTPFNPYAYTYTHSPPPPEVGRSTYTPPQIYHQVSEPTFHSKDTRKPFPERGPFTFANDSTEESTESSSSTPNHTPPHSPHTSHSPSPGMRRRLKKII